MRRLLSREDPGAVRGRSLPPLTSTDISTTAPATAEAAKREPTWARRAREHEEAQAEVMALLHQISASTGGLLALNRSAPPNDVLLQATYIVPASGVWTASWEQHFASVLVANLSAASLEVTSQVATETKPSQGAGVLIVPSGIWRLVPMRGTALSIYGAATSVFDLAVWVRPQGAGGGACGTG